MIQHKSSGWIHNITKWGQKLGVSDASVIWSKYKLRFQASFFRVLKCHNILNKHFIMVTNLYCQTAPIRSSSCFLLWTITAMCRLPLETDYFNVAFFISIRPACTIVLMTVSCSFSVIKETVRWEMAPVAAAGHWGGCYSLCWRLGNWNPVLGAPCRHFHQWKNPSWKICQQGNNSASKFINVNNPIFIKYTLFGSQEVIQRYVNLTIERGNSLFNE